MLWTLIKIIGLDFLRHLIPFLWNKLPFSKTRVRPAPAMCADRVVYVWVDRIYHCGVQVLILPLYSLATSGKSSASALEGANASNQLAKSLWMSLRAWKRRWRMHWAWIGRRCPPLQSKQVLNNRLWTHTTPGSGVAIPKASYSQLWVEVYLVHLISSMRCHSNEIKFDFFRSRGAWNTVWRIQKKVAKDKFSE